MAKPIAGLVRVGREQTLSLRGESLALVEIQAGEFVRGNAEYGLPHFVRLTKPFAIGRDAVTWGQWRAVARGAGLCTATLGGGRPDHWPVAGVDWEQAREWTQAAAALTGTALRLPTDAEWSLAAQGAPVNIAQLARDEHRITHSETEFRDWLEGRIDTLTHPTSCRFFLADQMTAAWQAHHSQQSALIGMRRFATIDGRCPESIGTIDTAGQYVPADPPIISAFGVHNMLGGPYEWLLDVGGPYAMTATDGMIWEDPRAGSAADSDDMIWEPHVYRGGTPRQRRLWMAARRQWRALGSDHDWGGFGLRVVIGDLPPVGGRVVPMRPELQPRPARIVAESGPRRPITPLQIRVLHILSTHGPLALHALRGLVSTPTKLSQLRNLRPAIEQMVAGQYVGWELGGPSGTTRLMIKRNGTRYVANHPLPKI